MKMKRLILLLAVLAPLRLMADNYLLNGGQESRIKYRLQQRVEPMPGMNALVLSFVTPASFSSVTYQQRIEDLDIVFDPPPTRRDRSVDARGNEIMRLAWQNPRGPVVATIAFTAANSVSLKPLESRAPFPPVNLPPETAAYLGASAQVQTKDARVIAKSRELTANCKSQIDAVQNILFWTVDHLRYVLTPKKYDALFAFETGEGNCQNYSHLSAALMRAAGIPVRIVNGVTLKEPYDVKTPSGIITLGMAQGRHSWVEVYFPDLGWTPVDPQQTQLFVSNRFIRVEVGVDNNETMNDGLVRWTAVAGTTARPGFEETIAADFTSDQVSLDGKRNTVGPRKTIFGPEVRGAIASYVSEPKPEIPLETMLAMRLPVTAGKDQLATFGNLDFPEGTNFLLTRGPAVAADNNEYEMRKNFLVETAEYVTRQAQYVQITIPPKSMKVKKIGLALQKFGGEGYLWVEILKDENKLPGTRLSTSRLVSLNEMSAKPGYYWMDFDFSDEPLLEGGKRYWLALGFSGSPIVNWFYSYGKPVGPADGTRYRTILDTDWSRSLSFEFNYRVQGVVMK
jgi:transglutaminase-like putative cysteine protease